MRTLVVSDLHLGSRSGVDVLRRDDALAALVGALAGVDRLVLLGDVLELRHGPVADAIDAARPVLRTIGAALGPGAEVVILAGNHDHALVAPWLESRAVTRSPLGLEERGGPDASAATAELAEALLPARADVAYPGIWLRADVYATHGHYLDRHVTVPTFERLAIGAMARVIGSTSPPATPGDYEAVLAPVYGWQHAVARHATNDFGTQRQLESQRVWQQLSVNGSRSLRGRALMAGVRLGVLASNRLRLGPVSADLSPQEFRRAGLRAMRECVRALGIGADWVIFGHTHRAGPFPRDDPREWQGLVNSGSWVHEDVFAGREPGRSPYWPGGAVEVGDEVGSPPRLVNLLTARSDKAA
ncbi:MAG TPA: metallophosphoesterase [Solirubrobacteraceae bacterium]|nr:metallophosphoesterase [Solirubrobacteraceae bacterium]